MIFKIAWKYFWSKKSVNIIHVMVWISILAVSISTMSLLLLLNVFNGFEKTIQKQYNDFYPQLKLQPTDKKYIAIPDSIRYLLAQNPSISRLGFIIEERALIQKGDYKSLVWIAGVDTNFSKILPIEKHIYNDRQFLLGDIEHPSLLLNENISYQLHLYNNESMQESLIVRMPKYNGGLNPSLESNLSTDITTLQGIFENNDISEKERQRVYAPIDFIQSMLNVDNHTFSSVIIQLKDSTMAKGVKKLLQQLLKNHHIPGMEVLTIEEQNKDFYNIVKLERKIIFFILTFILIIASCGIIGSIRMLIIEKQKDTMILFALGISKRSVYKIFIIEGFLIGIIGCIIGIGISLIISILQLYSPFLYMPSENEMKMPYPIGIRIQDIVSIFILIMIINSIAIWIGLKKFKVSISLLREQ
ncbi:MAG: FtsX-like permease family protein [Chitinophagaceae bacterium]